jgi:hypothetical protein
MPNFKMILETSLKIWNVIVLSALMDQDLDSPTPVLLKLQALASHLIVLERVMVFSIR